MHKRSLVLLSALVLALCVPPLYAGQTSGKHTVKKSKTADKKKKSKTTRSTTTKTAPTGPDQTTITPGGPLNSGTQTSYNPNKGPRRPAPPKKKKP